MKIALLQAPMFPMNVRLCGGLERVEIEEVTRLISRGHDARLFVAKSAGSSDERPEWLKVISDLSWKHRVLKWWYPLRFMLASGGADIYHGHYVPSLNLLAGSKSIVHFHGFVVSELPLYRFGWARRQYHAAHYIFCAGHLRDTYRERYPDLPEDHLHVLYNGVDTSVFLPRQGSRKPGPMRISFHGRWAENKGIIILLEAIKILEQSRNDFECYIAGSSSVGLSIEGEKIELKIDYLVKDLRTVKFPGAIAHDALPSFLAEMDLCVVPSTYPDPFPLVPLEAMACGLPVVAFDIGGLQESVINGTTGLLAKDISAQSLANAIGSLLDDATEVRRMGVEARRHVLEKFTWDTHIDQLVAIYRSMTGATQ